MMIAGLDLWFWLTVVLGGLSCLVCLVQFMRGQLPNDYSQGSVIILQAWLVVYLVGSIIMHILTDGPRGDWLEYYGYLIVAMLIPAGTLFWSFSEKTRWATLVLGLAGPVLIVMVHRMNMLWYYY